MPYTKQWGSTHPGCLIILLDRSGSMSSRFGGKQLGAGSAKCDMVATVLNGLLHEFVRTNTVGAVVKPRADIAVLGYGSHVGSALAGPLASKPFVSLSDLIQNPLRVETRMRKEVTDDNQLIETQVSFPIWVEPVASNGTPMAEGLQLARQLASQWVASHPDNYPPVVINVTDGEANTDIRPAVAKLLKLGTSDGSLLFFNCHITTLTDQPLTFPVRESEVPNDQYARLLFSLSSIIPDTARDNIRQAVGATIPSGARGFIFNGDAGSVRQMFTFATVGATNLQVDPNR